MQYLITCAGVVGVLIEYMHRVTLRANNLMIVSKIKTQQKKI